MKKIAVISFIILTLCFTAFAQKKSNVKSDPAKDVKAAFDRLVEGIKEANADKVMGVYENSDRTLFFNYNGTATIGWQNMFDNRKASYADRTNVNLETTGIRVEVLSPTSAYVSCKWKQTQEYKGELETSTGRMTLIFKKIGKDWKIVHLHTSPDAAPDKIVIPPSEKIVIKEN
ncbi:MAG: nuclear transport factor 2 family protein [Pyrinomonadaceae bacterium]